MNEKSDVSWLRWAIAIAFVAAAAAAAVVVESFSSHFLSRFLPRAIEAVVGWFVSVFFFSSSSTNNKTVDFGSYTDSIIKSWLAGWLNSFLCIEVLSVFYCLFSYSFPFPIFLHVHLSKFSASLYTNFLCSRERIKNMSLSWAPNDDSIKFRRRRRCHR